MPKPTIPESEIRNAWYTYLTTGNMPASLHAPWFEHKTLRPILKFLPKSPRCRICYIPFRPSDLARCAQRIDHQRGHQN